MSRTDFIQDLKLLFLSLLLTGLAATDYFTKQSTAHPLPKSEVTLPKLEIETESLFSFFRKPANSPTETLLCPAHNNKDSQSHSLKC